MAQPEVREKPLCVIVRCLLSLTEKINKVIISIERFYIQVTSRSQRYEELPFFFLIATINAGVNHPWHQRVVFIYHYLV